LVARESELASRGKAGAAVVVTASGCILLPLFCIFSFGPVIWCPNRSYVEGNNAFPEAFYFPLGWLCENVSLIATAIDWYVSFWAC
jgi:hypothetical protein